MGAGAETLGGGTEGQALDIKAFNPRVSRGDLIVLALAALLVATGGVLKQFHDNRTVLAEAGGVNITYPRGWFRYTPEEPELLHVVSNEDGETTLQLFAQPAGQADLLDAIVAGVGNPAVGKIGYVQLANSQVELAGNIAYRTDYAYVNTAASGTAPPEVIRGRQIAWIMNDEVRVLALESPDSVWEESKGLFDPIVDQLQV
jgi:hypothetical protein